MKSWLTYRWLIAALAVFGWAVLVQAQTLPDNQLVIFPAKLEFSLAPGERAARTLTVYNNASEAYNFTVSFESIASVEGVPIELIEEDQSPYHIARFARADATDFRLAPGEERKIEVSINFPPDAPAGSLHGAVVVTAVAPASDEGVQVSSRMAGLILIKNEAEARSAGKLVNFGVRGAKIKFSSNDISYFMSYQNEGNVYLNPYGHIELRNFLTGSKRYLQVDPWFVLPGSTRNRQAEWSDASLGVYRATLSLNRGYEDIVDTRELALIILPWPIILAFVVVAVIGMVLWKRK